MVLGEDDKQAAEDIIRSLNPKMIVQYGSSLNKEQNPNDMDVMVISDFVPDVPDVPNVPEQRLIVGRYDLDIIPSRRLNEEIANIDFVRRTKFRKSKLLYGDLETYDKIKQAFNRQPEQRDAEYQRQRAAEGMIHARHFRTEFEHKLRLETLFERPSAITEALYEDTYTLVEKRQPERTTRSAKDLYESLNDLTFVLSYLSAEESILSGGTFTELDDMISSPKTKRQMAFSRIFSLKKKYEHGENVGVDMVLKTYDETAAYAETILKQ